MPRSCRSSDVGAASTSYPAGSAATAGSRAAGSAATAGSWAAGSAATAGSRRGSSTVSPAVASRITASIAMASSMAETELARVRPSLA